MRPEARAALVVTAVVAAALVGAGAYARAIAPLHETLARAASPDRCIVRTVEVVPKGPGDALVLRTTVDAVRSAGASEPIGRSVSTLGVGGAIQLPMVLWAIVLAWPLRSGRQRALVCGLALTAHLAAEFGNALTHLDGCRSLLATLDARPEDSAFWWSRFLEGGGRWVLGILGGVAAVETGRRVTRDPAG